MKSAQGNPSPFAALIVLATLAPAMLLASSCATPDAGSGASPVADGAGLTEGELQPVRDGVRTLVVFYTRGGTSMRVAEDLARILDADLERITDRKPRSMSFFGYMDAGRQATFGLASAIGTPTADPAAYGRVVVCTPVWAGNVTPPIRSYLRAMKSRLPARTGFVTVSGGTGPDKIVAAMSRESGAVPVAVLGLSAPDFTAENRQDYVRKIEGFVGKLK